MHDWIPKLSGIGVLLAISVISFYFLKTEKSPNAVPNQLISRVSNNRNTAANQTGAPQISNTNAVQNTAKTANGAAAVNSSAKTADLKPKQAENLRTEPSEKTYFCGAATKKGTPCSRRVKGGGRCWQHEGQAAMAASDKLFAGR